MLTLNGEIRRRETKHAAPQLAPRSFPARDPSSSRLAIPKSFRPGSAAHSRARNFASFIPHSRLVPSVFTLYISPDFFFRSQRFGEHGCSISRTNERKCAAEHMCAIFPLAYRLFARLFTSVVKASLNFPLERPTFHRVSQFHLRGINDFATSET